MSVPPPLTKDEIEMLCVAYRAMPEKQRSLVMIMMAEMIRLNHKSADSIEARD